MEGTRQRLLRDPRHVAMAMSLVVSFFLLAGKVAAYLVTGSAAIYSDAAESVIHLVATGFVAFSLWYAVQPPDQEHPYGHGKIAYFSTGVEGSLILLAALTILYSAARSYVEGPRLRELGLGVVLMGVLSLLNLGLGLYLIRVGRRHRNLVLVSNGQHVLTDMWTSAGVLAGVALVWATGLVWIDPLVAVLMAANIGWMGVRLVRRSVSGLMEEVNTSESQTILRELDRAVGEGVITGYHQVRYRRVHDQVWIEYHLLFPGDLSLAQAHERSHAVEEAIAVLFKDEVIVTAHLEPEAHDAAHPHGHAEPVDPLRGTDG